MRATIRIVVLAIVTSVLITGGVTVGAQTSRQAAAQLKAAQQLEEAKGDLAGAMEAYRKLATTSDRAIAAQALLGLARCQEKQGLPEAKETFQKVVAQFADQPAVVAEASKRLAPQAPVESQYRQRMLWKLAPNDWITGRVSVDGQLVAYTHLPRTFRYELRIRNLITGADRQLAVGKPEEVDFEVQSSAFSRDGQRIAYRATFIFRGQFHQQLRVAELRDANTTGHRVLRDDLAERTPIGNLALSGTTPYDWTPDNNWIAVQNRKAGMSNEFGLVSLADGSIRALKSFESRRTGGRAYLSPDGAWLAAEVPEAGTPDNDIIVVATTGGPEIAAVSAKGQDTLMGWSPDGREIIFSNQRSGARALWRQQVVGGELRGGVQLIPNLTVNADQSLGLSPTGSLYSKVAKGPEVHYIMEAQFDFQKGEFTSPPLEIAETHVRANSDPRWSPDGKFLAYYSNRGTNEAPVLQLRSIETGETREVRPDFRFFGRQGWTWLPDSQSIAAIGQPRSFNNNRRDLYRIDMRTGESTILAQANAGGRPELSEDGKILYYNREGGKTARDLATGQETVVGESSQPRPRYSPDGKSLITTRGLASGFAIVQRDLQSGVSRDLLTLFPAGGDRLWFVTADFRHIVAPTTDRATGAAIIVLHDLASGQTREVFRRDGEPNLMLRALAPDNRSVIVGGSASTGRSYWWVPLDGRPSRPLDALNGLQLALELSPDGRRIAFDVRDFEGSAEQVWVLENFLATLDRRR